MARGSIVKRCPACGNKVRGCPHKGVPYAVTFYVGNRKRWETVGPNRHVAERRLAEIQAELALGAFREPKPITFSEFGEKWLKDYAWKKVKPSTRATYRILIAHRLNPAFGKLPLSRITGEMIDGFLTSTMREGKLAPKTVNNTLILMKTMLKCAKRWEYLRENPAEEIERLKIEPKEMDFLTPPEIRKFLDAADEPYRTLFSTAILTGMRQGELLGLQWGDIDWNRNLIYVQRSLYWRPRKDMDKAEQEKGAPCWMFSTPKTPYSRRTIILSPRLKEALEMHRLTCPVSPWDLVFCTRKGTPFDPPSIIYHQFFPALTRAGLRRIRFHDMRHTYTALLIAQGENVKFIQSQLGHASATTTLDRYGHLMPNAQRETGTKLDEQVFGPASATVALLEGPQNGENSDKGRQTDFAVTDDGDSG